MKNFERDLQGLLEEAIEKKQIAGANLKILHHQTEYAYVESGYADIENKIPFTRNTIMRLYSMSKPITGAAAMLLFEQGKLDLMQPVSDFLPGFAHQTVETPDGILPTPREVNVKDLLSMSSGLSYGDNTIAGQAVAGVIQNAIERLDSDHEMTTQEFANRLGTCPLSFVPGSQFMYGTSADVMGAIIEVVSGMRFSEFLAKYFFEPLEMYDTAFWVTPDKQPRLAKVYDCDGKNVTLFTYPNLAISNHMKHAPSFESGGAGLTSTLEDYSKFASMLLNHGSYHGTQILQPATVEYFTTSRQLPWQRDGWWQSWTGVGGYEYDNFLRIMHEPQLCDRFSTMGEYGWDGWLGPYFANHPSKDLTFLLGVQKKDAGTFSLTRKLINYTLSHID